MAFQNGPAAWSRSAAFRDVLVAIGPPSHRALMQLSGAPLVYRTMWKCGCTVDVSDDSGPEGGVEWNRCAVHTAPSERQRRDS